jgi:predicted flap endonuclease-1-like 5' DNA nuclease
MARATELPALEDMQERARKAMAMPIGLASPMWLAFGAAASAGVAWWWMTRWTRATNLEAMTGAAKAQVAAVEAMVERESEAALKAVEAAERMLEATAMIEPRPVEIIAEPADEVEQAFEPTEAAGDDLTRLTGIGPKLASELAARGIRTFAQLADWTEDQAQAFDSELSLKGRVARDAWIAQARRLAGA